MSKKTHGLASLSAEALSLKTRAVDSLRLPGSMSDALNRRRKLRGDLCDHEYCNDSPASQLFISELKETLGYLDVDIARYYGLPRSDGQLWHAVGFSHRLELQEMARHAFGCGDSATRILFASVLTAECVRRFELPLSDIERPAAETARARFDERSELLTHEELLALVDYLHPHTHTFLVLNGAARLSKYWAMPEISETVALLGDAYLRALEKLSRHPEFIDRSGRYYKGANLAGPREFNLELLDHALSTKGTIFPAHPISTTVLPEQSFLGQGRHSDNVEFIIEAPQGIDVRLFHGALGQRIGEVILRENCLRVTGRRKIERHGATYRQYTLERGPSCLPRRSTCDAAKTFEAGPRTVADLDSFE